MNPVFQIFGNGFLEFLTAEKLLPIITGLVIIAVILVADRMIRRAIARYSKGLRLEPHVENIGFPCDLWMNRKG